jgi:hypothetical protein
VKPVLTDGRLGVRPDPGLVEHALAGAIVAQLIRGVR